MEFSSIEVLQQDIVAGRVTSEALVEKSLEAIAGQKSLNAFITVDEAGAKERAHQLDDMQRAGEILGPLHGIPIAVKDNIHVAGLPNTAGTPALKDFLPARDAGVIKRLRAAGAIIIGKNNMHELAYGITSDNHAYGAVGNAYNAEFIAGGSSGGTAAAIASGMVIAGLGSDTGGSSRIPAALNGLVGFRPTTGRYPSDGLTRISQTRDTVGPMAHSVADVALLDSVLSGDSAAIAETNLSGLRLGVPRAYFYQNLEPAVAAKTEALLRALSDAGVELVDADIAQLAELNERVGFPLVLFETGELLRAYIKENLPGATLDSLVSAIASPDVKSILTDVLNGAVPEPVYRDALEKHRPRLQQAYRDYFARYGVAAVVFPTVALTARPIRGSAETVELNGEQVPTFPAYIRNTDPSSNAGIPALTIPIGSASNGMPIGIEIDGPEGTDRQLLAIGAAMERLISEMRNER